MSYLIIKNKCVAYTNETLKGGESVRVAWLKSGNSLCNAVDAKASNAKKWAGMESERADFAKLHSEDGLYKEFYSAPFSDEKMVREAC